MLNLNTRAYKFKLSALIFSLPIVGLGQVDTIFQNEAYTSLYSTKLKAPICVAYKLYRGGGNCDRSKFHFNSNSCTATDSDYSKSGYDRGHLANAEDFAYNCTLDSLTFMYYNCFPQTPQLNRGKWKKLETTIRKWSQNDSIIVLCGGLYNTTKTGTAMVPDTCWKVVYHLKDQTFSECYLFTNTKNPIATTISVNDFSAILRRYNLNIKTIVQVY